MATLDFKGKSLVQNYHLSVKFHELVPKKDKSLTDKVRLDDNLIIHGDNLKALKALLPTYAGKVKCICVDPPYNTGNEGWAYNDNVNSPMMQEWLGNAVDRDDLTRHDKWLCMMMPRLKLQKELLRDDGVIFISIDDNEMHRLRSVMDEVFGEENFLASMIWQKRYAVSSDSKGIPAMHDYILCYQKSLAFGPNMLPRTDKQDGAYSNPDNDPRGLWRADNLLRSERRERDCYAIVSPHTGEKFYPPSNASWRHPKDVVERMIKEGRIYFGKAGKGRPVPKRYLAEVRKGVVASGWLPHSEVGHTDEAKRALKDIFSELQDVFATPKPVRLIQRLLAIATDEHSIVLDSFAGSGTTAHAVLAMNKDDGGNRKFILVECEDYADKITAERVRRVIKGVKSANDDNLKKGLGGTFSYFELGKAIELDSILDGKNLPSYLELARYVFYTATGEEFDERKVNEKRQFIGESKNHEVYLFYKPDIDHLKKTALTLERAEEFGKPKANGKRRLVFAPTKYIDQEQLDALRIDFAQLPFEIYKLAR